MYTYSYIIELLYFFFNSVIDINFWNFPEKREISAFEKLEGCKKEKLDFDINLRIFLKKIMEIDSKVKFQIFVLKTLR